MRLRDATRATRASVEMGYIDRTAFNEINIKPHTSRTYIIFLIGAKSLSKLSFLRLIGTERYELNELIKKNR